ncbi:ABC-2 type transporter-domain-containing protein [Tuber borchii]|uniref:ABC-2 type transporter-domain-containing protein n=1 Tax=Tuber borchii TaxID=42251 RepID=A0A2T6ZNN6_TUBBO|nr:ABC-2 type transporter-domain-containing protein [Tuber borchii]
MPYSTICAVGFFICLYFPLGLNPTPSCAGYQFLMILVCELFSLTPGQMISALTPNSFFAALLNPFIITTFVLFCGVTILKPNLPKFWRTWLYKLDPFTRLIGGMVVMELHGAKVTCDPHEYNNFPIPDGQTCGGYAAKFMETVPGYIRDLNATGSCNYCAYSVGDEFFSPL